jgi:hypothetical protein
MTENQIPSTPDQQTSTEFMQPGKPAFVSRLVILRGPQAGEKILLQPGVNLLGREEGYILRDGRVSRRHAQIQLIQHEYVINDLDSTNGTFLNGNQITQPTVLQHGDTLRLGDTILSFRVEGVVEDDPSIVGARTPDTTLDRGDITLMAGRLIPNPPALPLSGAEEDPQESNLPGE